MPLALITGAGFANGIATGITARLRVDGWDVATSDLEDVDYPCDTGWMDADIRHALAARQPLGRLGTPTDIAGVVAFLVSKEARWVSGQLLHADGAFSARF